MSAERKFGNGFFWRVILIPSSVFLSVMFGGAYGSGREVVQYISINGPLGGLISILTIFLVYSTVLFLCFEIARLFGTYEYKGLADKLLGKGWVLYELLILIGLVVTMAICASTAGAISVDHFGIPAFIGGAILLAIIIGLNYFGRDIVEKSMMLSVAALGLALIYLLFQATFQFGDAIAAGFTGASISFLEPVKTGITQSFTSGGFIPILLFCAVQLKSRKEVLLAAIIAAFVGVLPAIALHVSFMSNYPAIIEETVPAYWLVEKAAAPIFLSIYVGIVFVMVAQTGVGLLHGVLERIDSWLVQWRGKPLTHLGHGGVAGSVFLISLLFASMGLVNLIVRAFTFFSLSFLVIFFIPLFTRGVWLVVKHPRAAND